MTTPAMLAQACRNHPDRPGLGACPACRSVICEECSTRVDGILHCRSCLATAMHAGKGTGWRSARAVLPALVLGPLAWGATALALVGFVALLGAVAEWTRHPR